jgi:hypothetical protein
LDGSLLWQATQFAKNTALPLCQSGSFADESFESFEQPTGKTVIMITKTSFIERRMVCLMAVSLLFRASLVSLVLCPQIQFDLR